MGADFKSAPILMRSKTTIERRYPQGVGIVVCDWFEYLLSFPSALIAVLT